MPVEGPDGIRGCPNVLPFSWDTTSVRHFVIKFVLINANDHENMLQSHTHTHPYNLPYKRVCVWHHMQYLNSIAYFRALVCCPATRRILNEAFTRSAAYFIRSAHSWPAPYAFLTTSRQSWPTRVGNRSRYLVNDR